VSLGGDGGAGQRVHGSSSLSLSSSVEIRGEARIHRA
jgi:hypothetical protein